MPRSEKLTNSELVRILDGGMEIWGKSYEGEYDGVDIVWKASIEQNLREYFYQESLRNA